MDNQTVKKISYSWHLIEKEHDPGQLRVNTIYDWFDAVLDLNSLYTQGVSN